MYVVMNKLKNIISIENKHMIKYIMRKIVLSLFALCCFSAVMAQQKTRSLSLDSLGNKFVTAEAVKAGADFGFARRTVMYMLKDFCQRNFIIKDKQGNYEKVQK